MMQLMETPTMDVSPGYITLHMRLGKGEIRAVQEALDKINTSTHPESFAVEIKRLRRKRSLDANAYYWVLVGEIAKAIGSTDIEVHNWLLMDYGEPRMTGDGVPNFVLMSDSVDYMRSEKYHLRPTDMTEVRDGVQYRWFVEMKGSHEYDTREMSRLIDGTVSEAKALGIETMTPDQIEELKQRWGA